MRVLNQTSLDPYTIQGHRLYYHGKLAKISGQDAHELHKIRSCHGNRREVSDILDQVFKLSKKAKKPKFNVGQNTLTYYRDKRPNLDIL